MNTPSGERQLFGTLLASEPGRTRSWRSLFIAVAIHAALVVILIVTFKPFQSDSTEDAETPISMIVVEEDDAVAEIPNPFVRSIPAAAPAPTPRSREEQLVLPTGPLAPIVIEQGPPATTDETVEPTGRTGNANATLADRLRPSNVDPRINTVTAFPPAERTGAEAVRARIADRLTAWNDSIAAEEAADRKDSDWTIKGKDGKRWGISKDGIHLGGITIPPYAVAFTPPPGRRDEIAGRLRDFAEIEKQAMLEESRSSFKERVQLIRERKDRERAEKKKKVEEKPITDSR